MTQNKLTLRLSKAHTPEGQKLLAMILGDAGGTPHGYPGEVFDFWPLELEQQLLADAHYVLIEFQTAASNKYLNDRYNFLLSLLTKGKCTAHYGRVARTYFRSAFVKALQPYVYNRHRQMKTTSAA